MATLTRIYTQIIGVLKYVLIQKIIYTRIKHSFNYFLVSSKFLRNGSSRYPSRKFVGGFLGVGFTKKSFYA